MFEREFNRAKTKAIGLLLKETDLGEAKIAYLESLSKQSIDSEIDFKNLVKNNILKKGIRLGKLIEIEYAKYILMEYINHKHTYLSDVEKEVCLAKSIKKMYDIKEFSSKGIELKIALFEYAKNIKTGKFYHSIDEALYNYKLADTYGDSWVKFIECLKVDCSESEESIYKAQRILAENALEDISKCNDISDYIIRVQYILNAPLQKDKKMDELVHKYDLKFLANNNVEKVSGLTKIYTLRDTLAAINSSTRDDENKTKYIAEYNYLINAFNKLPKIKRK